MARPMYISEHSAYLFPERSVHLVETLALLLGSPPSQPLEVEMIQPESAFAEGAYFKGKGSDFLPITCLAPFSNYKRAQFGRRDSSTFYSKFQKINLICLLDCSKKFHYIQRYNHPSLILVFVKLDTAAS